MQSGKKSKLKDIDDMLYVPCQNYGDIIMKLKNKICFFVLCFSVAFFNTSANSSIPVKSVIDGFNTEEVERLYKEKNGDFGAGLSNLLDEKAKMTKNNTKQYEILLFKISVKALNYCYFIAARDFPDYDMEVLLPIRPTEPNNIVFFVGVEPSEQDIDDYKNAEKELQEMRGIQNMIFSLSRTIENASNRILFRAKAHFTVDEIKSQIIPYLETHMGSYKKLPNGIQDVSYLQKQFSKYCDEKDKDE